MLSSLANKKNLVAIIFISAIGVLGLRSFNLSSGLNSLSKLEGGVNTCFLRLNQTFTSRLIGSNESSYLGNDFKRMTEECFAESFIAFEEISLNIPKNLAKTFNNLISEVHWFHQKLDFKTGLVTKSSLDGLNEKFATIENLFNEVLAGLNNSRAQEVANLNLLKMFIFSLSILTLALLFWENSDLKYIESEISKVEAEALKELESSEVNSQRGKRIINQALQIHDMDNCKELFSRIKLEQSLEVAPAREEVIPQVKITPKVKDIDTHLTERKMDLSLAISRVIERLSSQLFTQGIVLDLELKDRINILANREQIELLIFHLFQSYLSLFNPDQKSKKISITIKRLGQTVLFDIEAKGTADKLESSIDYEVVKAISEELQGSLTFKQLFREEGLKSRVQFRYAGESKKSSASLVSLKKGSKKDLLADIQNGRLEQTL